MYAIQALDDAERRKRLIRNEIVRDIVSSMYAFMTQPNFALKSQNNWCRNILL